MKPFSFYRCEVLSHPLSAVKGVGTKKDETFRLSGFSSVGDLLYYRPRKYIDRSRLDSAQTIETGKVIQIIAIVKSIHEVGYSKKRLEVAVSLPGLVIKIVFFRFSKWLKDYFEAGDTIFFSGKIENYRGIWQMVHPDFEVMGKSNDKQLEQGIVSFYKTTEQMKKTHLDSRALRRVIYDCLEYCQNFFNDPLESKTMTELGLPSLLQSLKQLHFPDSAKNFFRALIRLKTDEIMPLMFLLEYRKMYEKKQKVPKIAFSQDAVVSTKSKFPFELTNGQKSVIDDIITDISSQRLTNRLIQGDVGSGKTAVAFFFVMLFANAGYQSVIMAPTEVLAKQHYMNFMNIAGDEISCALLTGDTKEKQKIKDSILNKQTMVLIGTHALIEDDVTFDRLAFAVIDEQHRFGVDQRLKLIKKSGWDYRPHVIHMTATPIPRTMTQTLYGDLDVSVIDELPPGRQPITTKVVPQNELEKIYKFVEDKLDDGCQAFFIYPLVEEGKTEKLKSAVETALHLTETIFPNKKIGLLHGKMKSSQKETAITDFRNKMVDILVSTTVVEVGVDIPNATIMVIENAERFGLSQLHQLRGRVGRGNKKSYCFVIPSSDIAPDSLNRLEIFAKNSSGFKLSQEDLNLRGPGEFTGIRQSGITEFTFVNLKNDSKLISKVRKFAAYYLGKKTTADKNFITTMQNYLKTEYKDKVIRLEG